MCTIFTNRRHAPHLNGQVITLLIVAKMPAPWTRNEAALALRVLLAERFGLVVRRESKVQPVWALTVSKGGVKFHESAPEDTLPETSEASPAKSASALLRSIRNLGLDMVKQNAQVEMVIVERAEKAPTRN